MPRPPRPWFRIWSEVLDNAKLHNLNVARPDLIYPWLQLLSLANITEPRGSLPKDVAKITFALRESPQRTADILTDLQRVKLLDLRGGRLYMHDWNEWQPDSDANLTSGRVARSHDTRKERGRNAVGTPNGTSAHAVGTRSRVADTETDTDTDTEKEAEAERERAERERAGRDETPFVVPVVRAFERCFGRLLSPMEIENIHHLADEHPRERIDYALREAAELGKKNVRYIQRICENQEQSGDERTRPDHGANHTGRNGAAESTLSGVERAYLERIGFGASVYVDPPGARASEAGVGEEADPVGVEA